jgi:hypothetical protein
VHPPRRHLQIRFRRHRPLVHYGLQSLLYADHLDLLAEHLELLGEHPLAEHLGRRVQPDEPGAAAASFLDSA